MNAIYFHIHTSMITDMNVDSNSTAALVCGSVSFSRSTVHTRGSLSMWVPLFPEAENVLFQKIVDLILELPILYFSFTFRT